MQSAHLPPLPQMNRSGLVLLMLLLLVIVLGVLVYFFRIYPEDGELKGIQEKSPEKYPWVEEWRIKHLGLRKPRGHEERGLTDEHPDITETLRFSPEVRQEGESFGQMLLFILPDGTVSGGWGGDFDAATRMNYVIKSSFKGNIDPSKTYTDEDGEDPSKLYFITRGKYSELETNFKTSKVRHIMGRIYVVGWLSPELTAFGRIHMTPDKKTQKIFEWSGEGKPGTVFLPTELGF